jgi:hypothetical protein
MKVKHTQNGNVKVTLTMEQAAHLQCLLNVSHFISERQLDETYTHVSEQSNAELYFALDEAGIERHHG